MKNLKLAALMTAVAALAFGCDDDDDDDDDKASPVDAGHLMDASMDSGSGHDAGMFACPSWMPPENGKCGGPHCTQTPAELRAATPTTATCGSDTEVAGLCSLTIVNKVSTCAVTSFTDGTPAGQVPSAITTCTRATFSASQVSDACLTCYVDSAICAGTHCLLECLNPNTAGCDTCRVNSGCISSFYTCSGVSLP